MVDYPKRSAEEARAGGEPPPRFLVEAGDVRDGIVRLRGAEGHHAKNVVHLARGDRFVAIDGRGAEYEAVVQILTADGLIGKVARTTRRTREPATQITLAQALTKPANLAAVISQATALGVWDFLLFVSARARARTLTAREQAHLSAVAAAAAKQSLRSVVPNVVGPMPFGEALRAAHKYDLAFLCRPAAAAEPLATALSGRRPRASRILVMVGPEGGLEPAELQHAGEIGFRSLDLGPRRLRTELAGPVACALILHAAGDLGPRARP